MMYFWSEGSQCSVYKYQKISLSLPYTKIKRSHKRKWLCHRKMSMSSGHAYFFCWTIFSAHLWLLSASTHPHPFSAHVLGQPPLSSAGAWLITDYFPPRFSQPLSHTHSLSLEISSSLKISWWIHEVFCFFCFSGCVISWGSAYCLIFRATFSSIWFIPPSAFPHFLGSSIFLLFCHSTPKTAEFYSACMYVCMPFGRH